MILRRLMQHTKEQNWVAVGLDVLMIIAGIVASMAVIISCDTSSLGLNKSWEPEEHLEGLSLGMSRTQVSELKGPPKRCRQNACYWEWQWRKGLREPNLWVDFSNDIVTEIRIIGDSRMLKRAVPFKNIKEMHETLGPEIIHSTQVKQGFEQLRYTYPKWNISYWFSREREREILTGVSLVKDDWWSADRPHYFSSYYVSGKQVCPSKACPWDWKGELKDEYKSTTFEYFLNPSPEVLALLDDAKVYEMKRDKQKQAFYGKMLPDLPAAEAGIDVAQHRLGMNYLELGNQINEREYWDLAVYWLTRAATEENGYSLSQIELANLYESGIAVEQSDREAVNYLLMAAIQRREEAQTRLATKYREASGVQQNNVLALVWFQLAAIHGDWMAKQVEKEIAELKQDMTGDQIAAALDKVAIYNGILSSLVSEEEIEGKSLYKLAKIYQDHGNIQLAENSITNAAYRGWPEAQKWMATNYMEGIGVGQSNVLAYVWFRLAQFSGGSSKISEAEIAELQQKMTKDEIESAKKLAYSCWQDFVNNLDIERRVFNCGN